MEIQEHTKTHMYLPEHTQNIGFSHRGEQGYRNFEIQIGPLDRWRHRNMRPTIPNSHEN